MVPHHSVFHFPFSIYYASLCHTRDLILPAVTDRRPRRKAFNRVGNISSCARHEQRARTMYTLNFPNGMSQTYATSGELMNAAHSMGGTAKAIGNKTYIFVPKK